MPQWRVDINIQADSLHWALNSLTQQGFDIYQIDYIDPFIEGYSRGGNCYNVIAVKY